MALVVPACRIDDITVEQRCIIDNRGFVRDCTTSPFTRVCSSKSP
jgi:hypothetical protein